MSTNVTCGVCQRPHFFLNPKPQLQFSSLSITTKTIGKNQLGENFDEQPPPLPNNPDDTITRAHQLPIGIRQKIIQHLLVPLIQHPNPQKIEQKDRRQEPASAPENNKHRIRQQKKLHQHLRGLQVILVVPQKGEQPVDLLHLLEKVHILQFDKFGEPEREVKGGREAEDSQGAVDSEHQQKVEEAGAEVFCHGHGEEFFGEVDALHLAFESEVADEHAQGQDELVVVADGEGDQAGQDEEEFAVVFDFVEGFLGFVHGWFIKLWVWVLWVENDSIKI